jgi:hypothetical protein
MMSYGGMLRFCKNFEKISKTIKAGCDNKDYGGTF